MSTPILNELSRRIALVGEDEIFMRIAAGEQMKSIAATFNVSRPLIYLWIKKGGEERQQKFTAAREISSHVLVEDGMDILDTTIPVTSADVSLALGRANYRKWLAGQRNKTDFGEQSRAPSVQINVGSLLVEALKQHGSVQIAEAERVPLITEGEIEEEETDATA